MPTVIIEAECIAAVLLGSGYELSLIKLNLETITNNLHPSRGRLQRGNLYRVTFEEIPPPNDLEGSSP